MGTSRKGYFISFEGGEGAGKTTQIERLVQRLQAIGLKVIVTREPGGSCIGPQVRDLVLNVAHRTLTPRAELLLYEADRAQHVEEKILPALEEGEVVVTDRYADSSVVYQGMSRGLGEAWVKKLNAFATADVTPDLTVVLDIPEAEGLARVRSSRALDRMENENLSFHKKVRRGFLKLAKQSPRRYLVIDATKKPDVIAEAIWSHVQRQMERKKLWKRK